MTTPHNRLRPKPKMQSRRNALLESIINVLVGYGVAVLAQILIFPLFGLAVSLSDNLIIGLLFTVVSIARSYALRRAFEWWNHGRAA